MEFNSFVVGTLLRDEKNVFNNFDEFEKSKNLPGL